jgi:hypothetical protein
MKCKNCPVLIEFIKELKISCSLFSNTAKYLRKRRDCPGTKSFNKGVKIIDKSLEKAMKKTGYLEVKDEE